MAIDAPERRLTASEFLAVAARADNQHRLLELIDGEVMEKMGSFTPSQIAGLIVTFINLYLLEHPIGYVTGADGTYILSEQHAPMPDVGFISKARLPQRPQREVRGAPDLAVEVKSPNDTKRALRQKAELYLRFGAKMVWLVFPETQQVEVYLPDQDVRELGAADRLDGGDVLPGFSVAVSALFPAQ